MDGEVGRVRGRKLVQFSVGWQVASHHYTAASNFPRKSLWSQLRWCQIWVTISTYPEGNEVRRPWQSLLSYGHALSPRHCSLGRQACSTPQSASQLPGGPEGGARHLHVPLRSLGMGTLQCRRPGRKRRAAGVICWVQASVPREESP
jgi:hypothetical protein